MSQQFSNQGGAANSDPNALVRWLTSRKGRGAKEESR
jgi:hypothetical protein